MKKYYLLLLALSFSFLAKADEGMWLPSLVQKLNINKMKEMGCELSAEDIYSVNNSSLKDAIVALDYGSCTAEVISAEGLLLTNHHCGYGEIQAHSSVEHNYLKNGFWAKSKDQELPNPGKKVTFLKSMEDVTAKVTKGVTEKMTEDERNKKIGENISGIVKKATKDTHYEARVRSMLKGNKYFLFVLETFKDVRLVGAPPSSIGKYGGDTDNWMWPRHTCDFAMFRVYSGPDGKPAAYSEENIPLKTPKFLKISLKGVSKDDFAMVMGYPGRTNRYMTSWGVKQLMDVQNTNRVQVRGKKLSILKEDMRNDEKVYIQYASKYARSSNYWKYSIGQNKGLTRLKVYDKKAALESQFQNWMNKSADRKMKYGEALPLIKSYYDNVKLESEVSGYISEALLRGPEIFYYARSFASLASALEKGSDEETINKRVERLKKRAEGYFKNYNAPTDKKVVAALMKIYKKEVDPKYHPTIYSIINRKFKGNIDLFVDKMFSKSIFTNKEKVLKFLNKPKYKKLRKDLAFVASESIMDVRNEVLATMEPHYAALRRGERLFLAGVMEMNSGKAYAPNANSTMRVTYGKVGDYKPADAVHYDYFTTLKGVMEKEDPKNPEFVVPAKLKEIYESKDYGQYADADGTLHTCFTTNNDITGGNSGSPVMDAQGNLIGVAFDGNWEAMSGDIAFETDLQKCINVDIRYVLLIVDKYAGATNLIKEMEFVR